LHATAPATLPLAPASAADSVPRIEASPCHPDQVRPNGSAAHDTDRISIIGSIVLTLIVGGVMAVANRRG